MILYGNSRKLGSLLVNHNGRRVKIEPLDTNEVRAGKKCVSSLQTPEALVQSKSKKVVEDLSETASCSSSPVRPSDNDTPLVDRMDLCTNSDVRTHASSNTDMNFDPTSCSNQIHGAQFLNFNKKGGGHSHLKIDASSYQKLLQGKKIQVQQHKFLTTMTVRVYKPLPHMEAQTGTPHEDFSREAAVSTSSPLSSPASSPLAVFDFVSTERAELEDNIFQIDKKKRISLDSSLISKIYTEQFRFGAVREYKFRSRRKDHLKGYGPRAQVNANLKTTSLVYMEHFDFVCRYTKTVEMIKRNKRKDADLINFDAHYHPPFKKRWLSSSVGYNSKCSLGSWMQSSFGVSDAPRFVF